MKLSSDYKTNTINSIQADTLLKKISNQIDLYKVILILNLI